MEGIKHWVVMPASMLWACEGVPEVLPPKNQVRVFYDEDEAENYLLSIQNRDAGLGYMIYEAKPGVEKIENYQVYKIIDSIK